MANEITIDKLNNELAFNEEFHKYWNTKYPDRQYTSVTTLIGKYHEHFDEEFWSRYKALEKLVGIDIFSGPLKGKTGKRGPSSEAKLKLLDKKVFEYKWVYHYEIDIQEFETEVLNIKASYAKANRDACDRGTEYHLKKENRWYTKDRVNLTEILPVQDDEFVCEKNNFDLNRQKAILPEYLVYFSDNENVLHLAGQIDLLIKDGNDIYILDYKTNAKGMVDKAYFDFKKKRTQRMYFPINNIDDHMLNHYALQLSIYAWMLQRINPDFNIKVLRLLHIDGEGNETDYDVPYLKDDVERLLKHYKKSLKIKQFQDEHKKIL